MDEIVILGVFVADTTYRATRQPDMGETIMGTEFALGPGGKGSNQAVAASRLGSRVSFISRLGDDAFAGMAREMWTNDGITPLVITDTESFTGAAFIFVDSKTGDNAIIIVPGAAGKVSADDVERHAKEIAGARVFLTQLETPIEAARSGLEIARKANVTTILNPAPAAPLDAGIMGLCDYLVPNETEAEELTGMKIRSIDDARQAAIVLRGTGARSVIVTLGESGAYYTNGKTEAHVSAFAAGPVVETTGAGDSFCGALAHALSQGAEPVAATRYACAAASISVTRRGTASSMPTGEEVANLLERT